MTNNQISENLSKLPQKMNDVKVFTISVIKLLGWFCVASLAGVVGFGIMKFLYLIAKYILVFEF